MGELRHISEAIKAQPLTVELYVCELCRENGIATVGRLPADRGGTYRGSCTGPPGNDHKRVRMVLKTFREVTDAA